MAEALAQNFSAVAWVQVDGQPVVRLLDQRALPTKTLYLDCVQPDQVADAIRTLSVRGAPAIGIAAAYGVAQSMVIAAQSPMHAESYEVLFDEVCKRFAATRPTAVNLFWAIDRMRRRNHAQRSLAVDLRARGLVAEAQQIHAQDIEMCLAIGKHGAALMPDEGGVITHCNTGSLATGGHGTALGVIRTALAIGKKLHVWIDETRPLLQGARLTAWECAQDGIEATLITDNMAAHVLKLGKVKAAITGADRVAANGDSANKIGTYGLAILCKYHNIPFYIAAPTSTVDLHCPHGDAIVIEQRDAREVTSFGDVQWAPNDFAVFNPAFDVVPAALIAGIVTEMGVARPPFADDLARFVANAQPKIS